MLLIFGGGLAHEDWDDEDWADEDAAWMQIETLHQGLYDELHPYDTARGALVFMHLWTPPVADDSDDDNSDADGEDATDDDRLEGLWEMGVHLAEIIGNEIDAPGRLLVAPTLDAGDFGVEPALLNDVLADHDVAAQVLTPEPTPTPRADVVVIVVSVDGEPDVILDRVRVAVQSARATRNDSLVIVSTAGVPTGETDGQDEADDGRQDDDEETG